MQSLEPPYTFWPKEYNPEKKDGIYYTGASTGEQLYLEAKNAGRSGNLAAAKMCSEKFNPFNASHSICVGSFKLAGYIKAGEQILSNAEKKYSNLFGTV